MTLHLNQFEIFIGIKMLITNDNQLARTFDFHFEVCFFFFFTFSSNFYKIVPLGAGKLSRKSLASKNKMKPII